MSAWGAKKRTLDDVVAKLAADATPAVLHLLPGTRTVDDAGLAALGGALSANRSLRELGLSGYGMSPAGAAALGGALAANTTLAALQVGASEGFGDAAGAALCAPLAAAAGLRALRLDGGALGAGTAAALGAAAAAGTLALERLEARDNPRFGAPAAAALAAAAASHRLAHLDLSDCDVDAAGGAALCGALPRAALLLSGNPRLCDAGGGFFEALADALAAGPPLRALVLARLGAPPQPALCRALAAPGCALADLDLSDNPDVCAADVCAALEGNTALTRLDLSKSGVTDRACAALARSAAPLVWVDLSHGGSGVTAAGVEALLAPAALPALQDLSFFNASGVTDAGIQALAAVAAVRGLASLDLGACGCGPEGLAAVVVALEAAHAALPDRTVHVAIGGCIVGEEGQEAARALGKATGGRVTIALGSEKAGDGAAVPGDPEPEQMP